ncbi:DUF934 domain-containing protein [Alterinioella nitratireducens]|jgi:uncharacterized protein (DUF934 family)|uniref:DUF934 domain-containing protein n=1 Tax=Alterinioella nitratireducens TaxID=2735915 RepID=UPI001552097F|nr:DUF934 domain-containing protein [Alterinioella nitratireducens]NPD19209.1 DUF934 domain-containing protein [Alterinioella nitratireducens]
MKDLITETAALEAVLVTDAGFAPAPAEDALDIAPDADLDALDLATPAIRVDFASFADGRGFTIARRLRLRGYTGRLVASGHVLADQYAMARRSGFDAVQINADLAARQPEDQWLARADWQAHDHRARLRAA